jgi:7-cyano-7-deazaguanine reductase
LKALARRCYTRVWTGAGDKCKQFLKPGFKASLKPLRREGRREDDMTKEILAHSGLVIEETSPEALELYPLDTFAYRYPGKEVRISFSCPEFTAICPFSDFPDFATIKIEYVPNELCIELKSLKLYINSYRSVKMFHEHVVNRILDDFVRACDPISAEIEGDFGVRGNIKTVIRASYSRAANAN